MSKLPTLRDRETMCAVSGADRALAFTIVRVRCLDNYVASVFSTKSSLAWLWTTLTDVSPEVLALARSADCLRWNSFVRVSHTSPTLWPTGRPMCHKGRPPLGGKFCGARNTIRQVSRTQQSPAVRQGRSHPRPGAVRTQFWLESAKPAWTMVLMVGSFSSANAYMKSESFLTLTLLLSRRTLVRAGSHSYLASTSRNTSAVALGTAISQTGIRTARSATTASNSEREQKARILVHLPHSRFFHPRGMSTEST